MATECPRHEVVRVERGLFHHGPALEEGFFDVTRNHTLAPHQGEMLISSTTLFTFQRRIWTHMERKVFRKISPSPKLGNPSFCAGSVVHSLTHPRVPRSRHISLHQTLDDPLRGTCRQSPTARLFEYVVSANVTSIRLASSFFFSQSSNPHCSATRENWCLEIKPAEAGLDVAPPDVVRWHRRRTFSSSVDRLSDPSNQVA